MTVGRRLPSVPPLDRILPKGTESGKEFARIVDLLLFHEARKRGSNITLLDDASGDYAGLDSFETKKREIAVGYQYKFYSSPLSSSHRSDINKAIQVAVSENAKRPKKWILVTPNDFTNSALRSDGGDVAWFEQLRVEYSRSMTIEHYGHTKLLSLPRCALYLLVLLPFLDPKRPAKTSHLPRYT